MTRWANEEIIAKDHHQRGSLRLEKSMVKLECYFDCSSPWTYLGFHNLQVLVQRMDVEVSWRPIIVGGVFNKINRQVYADRANPPVAQKAAYLPKDIQDWARFSGLKIGFPPACGHPVNSVKCMRGCLVLEPRGKLVAFAKSAFEALWMYGLDLAKEDILRELCRNVGEDPVWFLAAIGMPDVKAKLRSNTDELMRRGGFGSPTFFVDGDMYFGNDRLVLVEAAILERQRQA